MTGLLAFAADSPVSAATSWTFGSLTNSLGHTNRIGGQDRTSPAIGIDGSVYVFGDDYRLRAITPGLTSGVFKWRSDTTNSTASLGAEGSPSVASDGTVWMVSQTDPLGTGYTTLYALDPATGTKKFSYMVGALQTTIGAQAIDVNDWSFTSFYERVVAMGANTNGTGYELKWEHSLIGNDHHKIATMPVIATHTVETSGGNTWTNQFIYWIELMRTDKSGSNRVFAMQQKQFTDKNWSTTRAWVWDFPGGKNEKPVGQLALKSDNTVYVLAENTVASPNTQRIYALNGGTGAQLWSTNLGFSPKSAPVLDQDGKIYVGGGDGLYRIDPDTYVTTKLLGTSAQVKNAPLVGIDGGIYYAYDNSTTAYVAYTNTFTTNSWSASFSGYNFKNGSPVMDRRGWLYLALNDASDTDKGLLLAVEGAGRPALSDWPMWGRGYSRNNRAGKTWRAVDLGTLGGFSSQARGLNQDNLVVGLSLNTNAYTKAVRTTGGSWSDLFPTNNANFAAYGVNDGGHIVGYRGDTSPYKGIRWKSDTDQQNLNGLSGNTYALGVNGNQRIVGYSINSYPTWRAVMWNSGSSSAVDIESLNGSGPQYASIAYALASSGSIVGGSVDSSGYYRAFLTDTNGIIDPIFDNLGTLGGNNSYAFGINDAHDVVGRSQIDESGWKAGYYRAFYLPSGGSMVNLDMLPSALSGAANDINNHGLIVGESQFSGSGVYRGWISLAGFAGLAELNTVTDLGAFESVYKAIAVNDRDAIVGIGLFSSGTGETHGMLLRPNE